MHNSKTAVRVVLFLIGCMGITAALNFVLEPNSIARVDLHNIRTVAYDDIFVGTSHGLSAINPEVVDQETGRKSTNLCLPGERLRDSYYIVKEACRTNKPKRIIYELDPSYWSTPENVDTNATYIYKNFPLSPVKAEYFLDKMIEMDWRITLANWSYYRHAFREIPAVVNTKQSEDYKNYGIELLSTPTQMFTKEGYMYQVIAPETDRGSIEFLRWDEKNIQEEEELYFQKLVDYCKKQNIELVVITTPVPKESLEAYREVYESANMYFTSLMDKYGIPYYDFNTLEEKELNREIVNYVDYEGHMSGALGDKFSVILGRYLKDVKG